MGIHESADSILLSRRCIVYTEMGREKELAIILAVQGVTNLEGPITANDIREHAEAVKLLWGVKSVARSACYICDSKQPHDKLCSCYFDVVLTTTNLREVWEKLPADVNAVNYICEDCHREVNVPGRVLKQQYATKGRYYMPTRCFECHKDKLKIQKTGHKKLGATLGDKNSKLADLQRQAAESTVVTPEG